MASRPARIRIANTGVDDQTSAITMAIKASVPSISHGIACCVIPSDCSALLTRPTLSLNRNLNWKPTRIGENIIGNIIIRAQQTLAARRLFDQQSQAKAKQHFQIERNGQK